MNNKGITKFWIEIIGGVIIVVIILVIVLFAASKGSSIIEDAAAKNAFDSFSQVIAQATTSGTQVVSPWKLTIGRDNMVYAIVYLTKSTVSDNRFKELINDDPTSTFVVDQDCKGNGDQTDSCLCLLNIKYKDVDGKTCDDLPYNLIALGAPGGTGCKEDCANKFNSKCFGAGIADECVTCLTKSLSPQSNNCQTTCVNKNIGSGTNLPCINICTNYLNDCSDECVQKIFGCSKSALFDLWSTGNSGCLDVCSATSTEITVSHTGENWLDEKANVELWNNRFPFGAMESMKVMACTSVKKLCSWRDDNGLYWPCLIHYKGKPVVWISAQGGETGFLSGNNYDILEFEALEMKKGLRDYYLDMIPTSGAGTWSGVDKICSSLNCKPFYSCSISTYDQLRVGSGCSNEFKGVNCNLTI